MNFFRSFKENLVHNWKATTIGTLCLVLGSVFIVDSQKETPRLGAEESLYAGIALLALGLILVMYAAAKNNHSESEELSLMAEALEDPEGVFYKQLRAVTDWDGEYYNGIPRSPSL